MGPSTMGPSTTAPVNMAPDTAPTAQTCRAKIVGLVEQWSRMPEQDNRARQHIMNQIIELLNRIYDISVATAKPDDYQSLTLLDDIIRMLGHKFTGCTAEEEDAQDVQIRHKIEAQLWLRINRHQLAIFRDYDLNVRKPRLRGEVGRIAVPLEDELRSMDMDEGENLDSEEQSEEESEYDIEYDEQEEGEGDDAEEEGAEKEEHKAPQPHQ